MLYLIVALVTLTDSVLLVVYINIIKWIMLGNKGTHWLLRIFLLLLVPIIVIFTSLLFIIHHYEKLCMFCIFIISLVIGNYVAMRDKK